MSERDDELESVGSDLEQMIAMLEKAEIDYEADYEDEEETILDINGATRMTFNEDGDLTSVNLIPH
jgi:hypothetical protein